jgi:hypothetical protein
MTLAWSLVADNQRWHVAMADPRRQVRVEHLLDVGGDLVDYCSC